MSNPDDYTVGWICDIKAELVAARVFLDETHKPLDSQDVHDQNSYTLGRVGKHNVVIAALPAEYEFANATLVATNMIRTFKNVRIGLSVGVGGGVPTRHDIRLGDIVVSTPGSESGGVFQYDYGKTIQYKTFTTTTGHLNQPPIFMQTAVKSLEVDYELEECPPIEDAINTVLENRPQLRQEYQRPDPNTDRLYLSSFSHQSDDDSCDNICQKDDSKLVLRPDRLNTVGNLKIHYGLIASGNQLIKDANLRDRLANEKDVLCFERKAAGLMNNFPCLVIRGICNYSDTHKNNVWKGYAAMTAAAYAKDVLNRIPQTTVEVGRKLSESDSEVHQWVKLIESKMEVFQADAHLEKIH